MTTPLRDRAEAAIEAVANRLEDPVAVLARLEQTSPGRWMPLSLTDGHPAVALLFAELARTDGGYRKIAHRHLAMGAAAEPSLNGLYRGAGALAFAAARAARGPGDYAGLLSTVDDRLGTWVSRRLRPEWERTAAGTPGTAFAAYDVVSGVTGVGRHLLDRGAVELTRSVLRYLVTLTEPVGGRPGWWVGHPPSSTAAPGGHANTGLAHGIAGPLALLSIAWTAGVRVPAQEEAAERIVHWLLEWSDFDEHGRYWPDALGEGDLAVRPRRLRPARTAWCYGTPGVARALHLAGAAFGRPEWTDEATAALTALVRRPGHGITDTGLCHGRAGILHLLLRTGRETGSAVLLAEADRLAARILDDFEPDTAFGFRGTGDTPGFLEGAAGVALALLGWLEPPASGWDAALLAG